MPNSELLIFEEASHRPIYEIVDEFNQKTLAFLQRHAEHGGDLSNSTR